jgi:hypothetical protein
MSTPVFANIKITGEYAETVRAEAERRRVSQAALLTEYALEGIEARRSPDGNALSATERRIASTMLALRGDVESLTATVDVLVATIDALSKLLLVHLPEPAADALDGALASATLRHENLLRMIATTGFDNDRPVALRRIAQLLTERLESEQQV